MKRSKRKQALTDRMMKVGLYWADTDTKHADGFYHLTIGPRARHDRLRTLDEVYGYVAAHEKAAKSLTTSEQDEIICDFWADLAD